MTGGRVRWAAEDHKEAAEVRREKRWAALPHLLSPWRHMAELRRPRPSTSVGTPAERADRIVALCASAAGDHGAGPQPPERRHQQGGRHRTGGGGAHARKRRRGASPARAATLRGTGQRLPQDQYGKQCPARAFDPSSQRCAPECDTDSPLPLGGGGYGREQRAAEPAQTRIEPTGTDNSPAQAIANTTPRQQQRGHHSTETDRESEEEQFDCSSAGSA